MRIKICREPQGSVLMVTLLTAGVIGMALASYLWLVSNQNLSTMRSLAWNSALPVAEAGVEEALTHLQYTDSAHLAVNQWADLGNGWVYKKRYLDATSYYEVVIKQVEPPIIISTASVVAPVLSAPPTETYGTILGQVNPTPATTPYSRRRLQVNTKRLPLFPGAMVAKGNIQLAGNNVSTDGFDSGDPNYSNNGKYDSTPGKTKASGDVGTNASDTGGAKTFVAAINVGDANVKGHVSTGPKGTAVVASNGVVGDVAFVDNPANGGKIQSGWQSHDNNFDFSNIPVPFTSGYGTPIGGSITFPDLSVTNYTTILNGALNPTYKMSTFGGKVYVVGNVSLWVTDDVTFPPAISST